MQDAGFLRVGHAAGGAAVCLPGAVSALAPPAAVAGLAPLAGGALQQGFIEAGGELRGLLRLLRGGGAPAYHWRKSAMPAASRAFLAMAVYRPYSCSSHRAV